MLSTRMFAPIVELALMFVHQKQYTQLNPLYNQQQNAKEIFHTVKYLFFYFFDRQNFRHGRYPEFSSTF